MQRQLAEVIEAFERAQSRLDRLTDNTPDERWAARSDPARWSVAECVAHLNLTSAAYVPRIRKAIEEARQLPRHAPPGFEREAVHTDFAEAAQR